MGGVNKRLHLSHCILLLYEGANPPLPMYELYCGTRTHNVVLWPQRQRSHLALETEGAPRGQKGTPAPYILFPLLSAIRGCVLERITSRPPSRFSYRIHKLSRHPSCETLSEHLEQTFAGSGVVSERALTLIPPLPQVISHNLLSTSHINDLVWKIRTHRGPRLESG